jgi:protein-tyrosine phosphatase
MMRIFPVEWPGPGRLAVATRPRPDALEDELSLLVASGYDTLVSLLTVEEASELGLRGEPESAARVGLRFVHYAIPDFGVPQDTFRAELFRLHDSLRSGAAIAAHCRGSVGRSPLVLASLLVLDGAAPDVAWERVSQARGLSVPDTDEQRRWIFSLPNRTSG